MGGHRSRAGRASRSIHYDVDGNAVSANGRMSVINARPRNNDGEDAIPEKLLTIVKKEKAQTKLGPFPCDKHEWQVMMHLRMKSIFRVCALCGEIQQRNNIGSFHDDLASVGLGWQVPTEESDDANDQES